MTGRRRKRQGVIVSPCALPLMAFGGWLYLSEPLRWIGLGTLVALSLMVAVVLPAVVISARTLPLALIPVRWRKAHRRRKREAAEAMGRDPARPAIPMYLQRAIKAADRNRCAYCKTPYAGPRSLQLDHFRPWAEGGLTVFWNMVTLCGPCNRVKSNCWVYGRRSDRPRIIYRAWRDADNRALALKILAFERWYRFSPGRWVRAGWSLAA